MQVDYDPSQVTYEQLLDVFWATHNPCSQSGSRQYMSAVFYGNEEQKRLALETRQREAKRRGSRITTEVLPLTTFTQAEDYHQKYLLRHRRDLMREFKAMYSDDADFVASFAAARVNGYVGGHGSSAMLEKEIDRLGLSEEGNKTLRELVRRQR